MAMRGLHCAYVGYCHAHHALVVKIVHIRVQLYLIVIAIILSKVPLKRRRAELHIDTKNKTKCAEMTNVEMNQFPPTYG